MKLGTIIKQSFYFFFAYMTLVLSLSIMLRENFASATTTDSSSEGGGLMILSMFISSIIWGVYCALHKKESNLDRWPMSWCIPLFIYSGLSNLKSTFWWIEFIIETLRFFLENPMGLAEICVLQLGLAFCALIGAQWFITLRSGQVLTKQLVVAYQSTRRR